MNLEDRFNLAVRTIQNLPPDGFLKPSNLTKLIFYGLYKQAMVGPCQEAKPSMFNYVARAKWEAWDRYRLLTKEQAMHGYIDEIRKIIETLEQTTEVTEFARSIGLSIDSVDNQTKENDFVTVNKTNDEQIVIVPSASSSSSSSSSISSSDIDDFYDDPSDLLSPEIVPQSTDHQSHLTRSLVNRQLNQTATVASSNNHGHHTTNAYNKETQRAILSALTKLQRDINNILERLNRLETSAYLLQQREIAMTIELNSSSKWFPLSGFPRRTIAFILFWPFIAYLLIRLYLRARISIRFRR